MVNNPHSDYIATVIEGKEPLELPIATAQGTNIGKLSPMTRTVADQGALVRSLTRWRNAARQHFLSQSETTFERSQRWLNDVVLADTCRLLFVVHSTRKPVGQLGFINLSRDSAELDNLIRGELGGSPQLMLEAERTLLSWLFRRFALQRVTALVLSSNVQAARLHGALGFEPGQRMGLRRKQDGAEALLELDPGGIIDDGTPHAVMMVLERPVFFDYQE